MRKKEIKNDWLTSVLSSTSEESPKIFTQAVVAVHSLFQVNHLGGLTAKIPLTLHRSGQLQGLDTKKRKNAKEETKQQARVATKSRLSV